MTFLLAYVLRCYAHCYLWRFRPRIVAVTGNAGKTSTKDAIAAVLGTKFRVRASAGNLNNELGVPLTIIGDFADAYYRSGGTFWFWLSVLWHAKVGFWFTKKKEYPEVLVLEYGADHPGDIKRLARRYHPHVAVVTQVGEVPVHVEFFASPKHLAEEKSQLVRVLGPDDTAVLNADDLTVLEMRSLTSARVRTFGLGEGADVRVTDLAPRMANDRPVGVGFTISDDAAMPVVIRGVLGRGVAQAAAAAVAVGEVFSIGLAHAVEALSQLALPAGRMRILAGIKDTTIIDDTYNASPAAMHVAIDAVRDLPGRKVFVLGDMLELGEHSVQAHQVIGTLAANVADMLVCVGPRGKIIADAASNQLPPERVHWYESSVLAAPEVQKLIQSGDIVLVKGSQGVRMERIVKEVMAEPERASELLVRQSARWLAK